jgi:anti-anti-sigma regulatory factor
MRHLVPFVSEQKVVRADDEQARVKRKEGRVIDDVVGTGKMESSWDDVVPDGWLDKSKPKPLLPPTAAAHASIAMPRAHVPIKASPKEVATPAKKTRPAKPSSSSAVSFSDSASMDWVRINNGRGLRVNIHGHIDSDLRQEWSRLLNDPESVDIKEFEFNLSETPALSLTGLGMLLLFKERKGSAHNAIKLCNCNKNVIELLKWTAMDKYFAIEGAQISPTK